MPARSKAKVSKAGKVLVCEKWCKRDKKHFGPCLRFKLADVEAQPSGVRYRLLKISLPAAVRWSMTWESDADESASGKTALYRVGIRGYCSEHRQTAIQKAAKAGGPQRLTKAAKAKLREQANRPTPQKGLSFRERKEQQRQRLANEPTKAEVCLREALDASEYSGQYEFQAMLYGYIPDFLFRPARLIVEADGWHHRTKAGKRADARRTRHLETCGYFVLRFTNSEIQNDTTRVMERIRLVLTARLDNDVRR